MSSLGGQKCEANAANEAQKSGGTLSSMRPWYRLSLLKVSRRKKFKVMDLDKQANDTRLAKEK